MENCGPLDDRRKIFELSPIKQALFEKWGKFGVNSVRDNIIKRADLDYSPLVGIQQSLWYIDSTSEASRYTMALALRLTGYIHTSLLVESLYHVVRHHEIFTVSIENRQDTLGMFIHPNMDFEIEFIDLSESKELQKGLFDKLQNITRPFSLANGPLFRAFICRISATSHVLAIAMHHIISDARSFGIFLEELSQIYRLMLLGSSNMPQSENISYCDWAAWRNMQTSNSAHFNFWKHSLGELPEPWLLNARESENRTTGFLQCNLGNLFRTLEATAARLNILPSALVCAIVSLIIGRQSGRNSLIVGMPVSLRNQSETKSMIGNFLNTIPLRVDIESTLSLFDLVKQINQKLMQSLDASSITFAEIVQAVGAPYRHDRNPLFDVLINYVSTPRPVLNIEGVTCDYFDPSNPELTGHGLAKFPITFYFEPDDQSFILRAVYQRWIFSDAYIELLLEQIKELLLRFEEIEFKEIDKIEITEGQSLAVLPPFIESTQVCLYPTVLECFDAVVMKNPLADALLWNGLCINYRDLAFSAQKISENIKSSGLSPGTTIAVCGPKSPGLIAAILAVWKAGCVLVLLDSALPLQRKNMMLEISAAEGLIVVGEPIEELQFVSKSITVSLSISPSNGTEKIMLGQPLQIETDAYIFFTSGSTGEPKGVRGTHSGLAHFLSWQRSTFSVGINDRVAHLTGLSFDVVLRELFTPLTSGACVVIPESNDIGGDYIAQFLKDSKITLLHVVPTLAASWMAVWQNVTISTQLRATFFAGEPLYGDLVRKWQKFFPCSQVVNLYGPTETTLAKCYHIVKTIKDGIQPVGRPLPETSILVLSATGRRCVAGEVGEVAVVTAYRTKGYMTRMGLHDPFVRYSSATTSSSIIYRTGDQGRINEYGELEILGRSDDQIKIRGVRIEPAEIVSILHRHPQVSNAYVGLITNESSEKILVAWVATLDPMAPQLERRLQDHLRCFLPVTHIPSAFVLLTSLPTSINGKVDRSRLPMPKSHSSNETLANFNSEVEFRIANIWRDVLQSNHFDAHTNFFDAGGHSLLLVKLQYLLKNAGFIFSMAELFKFTTVSMQAEHAAGEAKPLIKRGRERNKSRLGELHKRYKSREAS